MVWWVGRGLVLVDDGEEVRAFGEEDDDRGDERREEEEFDEGHRFGLGKHLDRLHCIRQGCFPTKFATLKQWLGSPYGYPIRPLWLALGGVLTVRTGLPLHRFDAGQSRVQQFRGAVPGTPGGREGHGLGRKVTFRR